jgi:hypothetical protein
MSGVKGRSGRRMRKKLTTRYKPDWLERSDGRFAEIRAMRERLTAISSDLGGAENLTRIEQDLLRRYVFIAQVCEHAEQDAHTGTSIDISSYLGHVDRMHRIGMALGLRRRTKEALSLGEYLATKAEQKSTTREEDVTDV